MENPNNMVCAECNGTEFIEAPRTGDITCASCGSIYEERTISLEAEYRTFVDDSESQGKVRVGAAYNPLMEYSLTERNQLERDEKEFLWDGLRNIEDVLFRLFQGEPNKAVQDRAKELFQKGFQAQTEQKKGTKEFQRSGMDKKNTGVRQRYSKRKQLVVTTILAALKEMQIPHPWTTKDISDALEGIEVSGKSVNTVLEELNLPFALPENNLEELVPKSKQAPNSLKAMEEIKREKLGSSSGSTTSNSPNSNIPEPPAGSRPLKRKLNSSTTESNNKKPKTPNYSSPQTNHPVDSKSSNQYLTTPQNHSVSIPTQQQKALTIPVPQIKTEKQTTVNNNSNSKNVPIPSINGLIPSVSIPALTMPTVVIPSPQETPKRTVEQTPQFNSASVLSFPIVKIDPQLLVSQISAQQQTKLEQFDPTNKLIGNNEVSFVESKSPTAVVSLPKMPVFQTIRLNPQQNVGNV